MKALVFRKSIPRYVAQKLIGPKRAAKAATRRVGRLCSVAETEIREPPLPTPEWVRVAPKLAGICGSDLSVICGKGSPYFSPLTSTPFVLGHEVVGTVVELGDAVAECEKTDGLSRLAVGDRVILEPALGCRVRGITPPCVPCRRGQAALCHNITRGDIAAGIQTGYCRDTGGAWSSNFVAHRVQLYPVDDALDDRAAVLTEPLACVLHGTLRAQPASNDTALVVGCGSIGLLTVAALRWRGFSGRIVVVAKYDHQRCRALELGADCALLPPGRGNVRSRYAEWADVLDAELHFPEVGKPTVIGGAQAVFDCIGSSQSIDDSVRFTNAGGTMVLIGMPGIPSNIDWTAIWYKELSVHAAYAYGLEQVNGSADSGTPGVHTVASALKMLGSWGDRLSPLVGEPFALSDYREAFREALFSGRRGAVKTVFGRS